MPIIAITPTGTITTWTRDATKLLGYTAKEMCGQSLLSLVLPQQQPTLKELGFNQKLFSVKTIELTLARKHAKPISTVITMAPLKDMLGKTIQVIIVINKDNQTEINKLKQIIADLKKIVYALNQSSIVAVTDKNGIIQYVNDKFVEISKYQKEELIGQTHELINSSYHPKEYIRSMWQTILSGKVWRGELKNKTKDGSYYWVDTTITPLLDETGKPKQFIAIRNDITKRKQLEQQKDEFIAIASHELKTPVTSLKAYIELAKEKEKQKGDFQAVNLLTKSEKQIDRLTVLINQLLDVSKIDTDQFEFQNTQFDLNHLIKDVVEMVQQTDKQHRIVTHLEGSLLLSGDRNRLAQVTQNILINAIKYSPQSDQVIVDSHESNGHAVVCIQDFGIGIPAKDQEKVFDKFYRSRGKSGTSVSGVGLGLYISAEIIRRHHGSIWVESEPGQGSTFYFSLPLNH